MDEDSVVRKFRTTAADGKGYDTNYYDSIVVHIPEEKILFIGDIYGDDMYRDRFRDLQKTRDLHRALTDLEFETAIPGHSEPLSKERLLGFLESFL